MLILICGLPRAGKTTYSEQYENVIHLDRCGSYQSVMNRVKHRNGDVVVDGVYRLKTERENLIRAYSGSGLKRCIWLNTPDEVRRSRQGWDKFCDKLFEPPTYAEGWDEIIIIGETNGTNN